MKNFFIVFFALVLTSATAWGQLFDTFSDGNYTANPAWSGSGTWTITANSTVSTGATGSNTLLNSNSTDGTDYLSVLLGSSNADYGTQQSWGFFMGRRTALNEIIGTDDNCFVWLVANESNLTSGTVDGYRVYFYEDNTGGNNIYFQRVTNGSGTDIITSSGTTPNGQSDWGVLVRVTRTTSGAWVLYTSTLPQSSGSGATADQVPNSTNASVNQGSVTDNIYAIGSGGGWTGNLYWGVVSEHTAANSVEFDNFYFAPDASSPLPVELVSFNASVKNYTVQLNWQTATEVKNYGFEVERSADKTNWSKIAFVEGFGNSNSARDYSYTDTKVSEGKYYYRLKQIDTDGAFAYSKEVEVTTTIMLDDFVVEQNFPNPFNPATTIKFGFKETVDANVTVYNALGSEVATLFNGQAEAGNVYSLNFDGSQLASGIYYYAVTGGNFKSVKKMMLMK